VELILRMFPPFPIPDFAPNFTGYDEHWTDMDWYDAFKAVAQPPNATVVWVSFT